GETPHPRPAGRNVALREVDPFFTRAGRQWLPCSHSRAEIQMPYTLPDLPYAYDALEPHIDAQTMEIHHSKHHNTYVANLNAAVDGTEYDGVAIEELIEKVDALPDRIRKAVRNNGGGHANHSLFWTVMSPNGGGQPQGEVAKRIESDIGGFDTFKERFTEAAKGRF